MEAARYVKIGQGANCIEAAAARIRGFLGDKYHMYRSEPPISQYTMFVTDFVTGLSARRVS